FEIKPATKARNKLVFGFGVNVEVCEEWRLFSQFRSWMKNQDWHGKSLDKDLLVPGNKIYCADRCIFLLQKINTLIPPAKGVSFSKKRGKYKASYGKNNLGRFATFQDADDALRAFKSKAVREAAKEYRTADPRLY